MAHRRQREAQPSASDLLQAALACGEAGVRVLPVQPRGKRALIKAWQDRASTDGDQIRSWWEQWPDANIGAIPGPRYVVIDIDPQNGGEKSLVTLPDLPPTATVLTGNHDGVRGRHLWYLVPEGAVLPTKRDLADGVELKHEGCYVLVPPSVHPSGGRYEW